MLNNLPSRGQALFIRPTPNMKSIKICFFLVKELDFNYDNFVFLIRSLIKEALKAHLDWLRV